MNTKTMSRWIPVVATIGACWSYSASAATTVLCPGTLPVTLSEREFSVTPNSDGPGAPTCHLFGEGNGAAGNATDANLVADPALLFLDKVEAVDEGEGLADGALFIGLGVVSGQFWVDATKLVGFENFIIAFTVGQLPLISPDWASYKFFNITECTAADKCDWRTLPEVGGSLSHATLYGTRSVVPLPAAAWLLGSGLLGLCALGRRRKASMVTA